MPGRFTIVHASFLQGRLAIWGELSGGLAGRSCEQVPGDGCPRLQSKPRRPQRSASGRTASALRRRIKPLPYDSGPLPLSEVLSWAGVDPAIAIPVSAAVWLPSLPDLPAASTPEVGPLLTAPGAQGTLELRPWQVWAKALPTAAAIDLLTACGNRRLINSGLHLGHELRFWTAVLDLALRMVMRGEFLPDVQRVGADGHQYRACWTPLWLAGTRLELANLAAAMPAVCRALAPCGKTSLRPAVGPESVVKGFVTVLVDHLVRVAAGEPGAAGARGRRKARSRLVGGRTSRAGLSPELTDGANLHSAWLEALRETEGQGEESDSDGARFTGVLNGPSARLDQLAASVREWQRPLVLAQAAPFRLTFRLEEPSMAGSDVSTGSGVLAGSDVSAGSEEAAHAEEAAHTQVAARTEVAGHTEVTGHGEVAVASDEVAAGEGVPLSKSGTAAVHEERWYVRYFLQSLADPSLLIPAEQVWRSGRSLEVALRATEGQDARSHVQEARELLLANLGRASRLCAQVAGSLKHPHPIGFALDTHGAYQFLTEYAPVLEQAGFGVLLPAWWVAGRTKLRPVLRGKAVTPKMTSKGPLSLDSVVEFDWQLALGDEQLTLAELDALARLKLPLVKVRGQWVQLNPDDVRAALELMQKPVRRQVTAREVLALALGGQLPAGVRAETKGIDIAGVEADGWLGDLLAHLEGGVQFAELPPPKGFAGTLRPYQRRGYSWLGFLARWGLGACLADDMGLGKTVQTLALVQRLWEERQAERGPVLLVCPTSVITNWQHEAARFTPQLPVLVHHGVNRSREDDFQRTVAGKALVITSYILLARDISIFRSVHWSGVILDEAQNIKNPATRQAKAARSLTAGYRIALTGTPVENNVGDLWSIVEFLNPGYLGSQADFQRRFLLPIHSHRDGEATVRLQRLTRPFILRRLKTDSSIISDLPGKIETKVYCGLTKEQATLYRAVVKDVELQLDETSGMARRGLILATLAKLKQICNHPAHFLGDHSELEGRSGKLNRLAELVDEVLSAGDRALIFTQFVEMGELLQRYLEVRFGQEVLFLHGGVPKARRDEMVQRFEQDGDGPPLFILSLKAGGTGLNLVRANHVFHFDRWWNPAVENQATDRAFRIGQVRAVQVHKFVCVGTIEEKIDQMIESKLELADRIVGSGEGWLTELSTQELRELFTLRREAISE